MATPLSQHPSNVFLSAETTDKVIPQQHTRTYQACIPCRRRKVRCDLGPVDAPHEPPCVRCRRESKDCYFSLTRRKRKIDGEDVNEEVDDDYAVRNRRRKIDYIQISPVAQQNPPPHGHGSVTPHSLSASPLLNGYNSQNASQQRLDPYYTDATASNDEPQDQDVTNDTAAALFQTPINTPGDALHLLLEASGRSEDFHEQENLTQSPLDRNLGSARTHHFTRPEPIESRADRGQTNIDPAIASDGLNNVNTTDVSREALKIWSRLRFVRAGWLTAREAMAYVNYFYEYLSPLTPIQPPDFRLLSTHTNLIDEEPVLIVTILTISTRYMKLEGPGGQTRSFMVHDRLWTYLQGMITRMFWGQEQFGGGFCGAGSQKAKKSKGLRSLGTIESLLLLSEFHPRSMHFPPGDDADEIFASTDGDIIEETQGLMKESSFAGWTEPALRSDRMCWSLVGTAFTLAYELDVFGSYTDGTSTLDDGFERKSESTDHRRRAHRIENLLFIYVTQTSGRLGFPSAFHEQNIDLTNMERVFDHSSPNYGVLQQSWVEIASIMKQSNATLFCSKEKTTELIRSGEYMGILQQLQPILATWRKNFENLEVPKYSKIILLIEFEYARVYINSLALQAVLDDWTANRGQQHPHHGSSDAQTFVGSYKKNEHYIKEVIDASRNLLRQVVTGLFPNDNLKHAPVRTHMRILSGAMFLLKTFALGAKKNEIATSLRLLDETVKALRTSVVDDVHLCLRVADLLEGLTSSIRHKFITPNARPSKHKLSPHYQTNSRPKDVAFFSHQYHGASADPRDNAFIIPPRDTTYAFHSNPTSTPNSAGGSYDYHQLYPAPSTLSEEDWLTLDLNPLLDPVNNTYNTADNIDWFGNFGPEMNDNLEVLGKLVNEPYRAEVFDSAGSGFN